jgi:hypothetical protein
MTLTRLNESSAGGNSPQIYSPDPYHLVVQGYRVDDPEIGLDEGEVANQIPAVLAIDAVCRLRGGMSMDDLTLLFESFSESAFRIEVRDSYLVDEEAEHLRRFLATGDADNSWGAIADWQRLVARHTAAGHTMRRVHLVRFPLSDYLRWEFAVQLGSTEAGEDIRVVDLKEHPEVRDIDEDVWLFDDRVPVHMVYDNDGRFLLAERIANGAIAHVRDWRDRAWEAATPLAEFMAGVG